MVEKKKGLVHMPGQFDLGQTLILEDMGLSIPAGIDIELPEDMIETLIQKGVITEADVEYNEELPPKVDTKKTLEAKSNPVKEPDEPNESNEPNEPKEPDEPNESKEPDEPNEPDEPTEEEIKKAEELKKRVLELIPNLRIYKEMSEDGKKLLLNAYKSLTPNNYCWQFEKDAFVDDNIGEGKEQLTGVRNIHKIIRGTIKLQDHMENNDVDNAGNADLSSTIIKVPRVLDELSPSLKNEAAEGMRRKVNDIVNAALLMRKSKNTLQTLRDIEIIIAKEQEDVGESIIPGEADEAQKRYMAEMDTTELAAVIDAYKSQDMLLIVNFEDIDWTNAAQRNQAVKILYDIQKENGQGPEALIDKIKVNFIIDEKSDLEELKRACEELNDLGIPTEASCTVPLEMRELIGDVKNELASADIDDFTINVDSTNVMNGIAVAAGLATMQPDDTRKKLEYNERDMENMEIAPPQTF